MKSVLLILLLLIIGIQSIPQWKQGQVETISEGSILSMTDIIPRKQNVQVKFDQPFFNKPQVGLSIVKINIDKGYPIDFHIDMGTVSKEGFNFWVNINSPKAFYSLVINWFATVDSNIQIKFGSYYTPECFNNDERDENSQYRSSAEINFDTPFEGYPPVVAAYLLGGEVPSGAQVVEGVPKNVELNIQVSQYDFDDYDHEYQEDYSFPSVALYSDTSQGQLKRIYYCIVAVPFKFSEAPSPNPGDLGGTTQLYTGIGSRSFIQQKALKGIFMVYKNDVKIFSGFSNLDSISDYSLQMDITNIAYDKQKNKVNLTFTANGDSRISGFQQQILALVPQDECAHLYSDCDYIGEILKICAGEPVNQIKDTEFGQSEYHIKSIKVPKGRTVTLYEDENLSGKYTQFHQDAACIDTWIFT